MFVFLYLKITVRKLKTFEKTGTYKTQTCVWFLESVPGCRKTAETDRSDCTHFNLRQLHIHGRRKCKTTRETQSIHKKDPDQKWMGIIKSLAIHQEQFEFLIESITSPDL